MQLSLNLLRRAALPVAVFLASVALHYLWTGYSLERECAQESRLTGEGCCAPSWWAGYVGGRSYWLGYSYGLALAFAAVALRQYREQRMCAARNLALSGITLSGFLAVAGCFLVGCCGSPMLAVYVSLFGTAFLPLAKPLVAVLTTVSIGAGWWWLHRQRPSASSATASAACPSGDGCGCAPPQNQGEGTKL